MDVILLHSGHRHVSATEGGENKNKNYICILVLTTLMMTTWVQCTMQYNYIHKTEERLLVF